MATLRFALDGAEFEIDLKEENAARLRAVLRRFTEAARPAGTPSRAINRDAPAKTIRAWARGAGFRVADRGALAEGVRVAFAAQHLPPRAGYNQLLSFAGGEALHP